MFKFETSLLFMMILGIGLTLTAGDLAAQTPLTTERVASGLMRPLHVTAPPKDLDRIFVVEQTGLIKIIEAGAVLPTPFIDLSGKASQSGNERGLLGLAFHPDYANNGYFYVNYTRASDHATVVERYTVSAGNPDIADPASGTIVLGPISQPYPNHNGGNIAFGLDGKLYIGMGDGGSGGDPECRAQHGDTLLGKMLRINDDGSIPADNPFVGNPSVLDEVWAIGLRNPWRFSFDSLTGDLYIGDVGQSAIEEIDYQPGTSTGGENYGWKVMEGSSCFSTQNCNPEVPPCNDPRLLLPIYEYTHSSGRCSVTAGFVYRGCAIPDLQGTYFFADYCTSEVFSFRYDGQTLSEFQDRTAELAPSSGSINLISSFGTDADGEIYIVSQGFGSNGGEIYKIVADLPSAFEDLGFAKSGTGGVEPLLEVCGTMGTGGTAKLRLRNALPSAKTAVVISLSENPSPLFGGILVPSQPAFKTFIAFTDADGIFEKPFNGGRGPRDVFVQVLVEDSGATQGVAFSNAIKAVLQP